MLPDESGVRSERRVDRGVPRDDPRAGVEETRVTALTQCAARKIEPSCSEGRSGSGPSGTVAVTPVGARLRAQRDQLGEVRNCGDVARLRNTNEAVRIQVVAEQERGVPIVRCEEP